MKENGTALHHLHGGDVVIYRRPNSRTNYWYARIKIPQIGKWKKFSTKTPELEKAIELAEEEYRIIKIKLENGIVLDTRRFRQIADLAIAEMQSEKELGAGKVIYDDYIRCLEIYKRSFGEKYITNINQQDLIAFDVERTKALGRKRCRSTINNYNSALARVYNLAVRNSWLHQSQVISFKNDGEASKRRPCFERQEIAKLLKFMEHWVKADTKDFKKGGVKKRTIQIRELLQDYIKFVLFSGLRPGTEMKYLKWKNVREVYKDSSPFVEIRLERGKNGSRTVIAKTCIMHCLNNISNRNPEIDPLGELSLSHTGHIDKYIFRLPDGSYPKDLNGAFTRLLEEAGLLYDAWGNKRTLYSLRHTYATLELIKSNVKLHTLALNMGTSIEMLERHYSHLKVWHHARALSGFPIQIKSNSKRNKEAEKN